MTERKDANIGGGYGHTGAERQSPSAQMADAFEAAQDAPGLRGDDGVGRAQSQIAMQSEDPYGEEE